MPVVTESVTSQLQTDLALGWYIAKDYYVDDVTPDAAPDQTTWDNSVITLSNPVANQVRIYVQNSVGGADILGIIAPGVTSIAFTDAVTYSTDRAKFAESFGTIAQYTAPGGLDLYFSDDAGGSGEMPSWIRFDSTWDYSYTTGRDPEPTVHQPYTITTAAGDEISPFTAPPTLFGKPADNELFAATIAYTGYDNDVLAPYYTIAIFEYDPVPVGDITGEYLGADRRFSAST